MTQQAPMKLQRPLPDTQGHDYDVWWAGLRRHELLVQECPNCRKLTHPPEPMCPHCRSMEIGWRKSSGKGKVYSYVVVHRPSHPYYADKVPYPVVLVELEEGFRVVGAIDCPPDQVREGLPVEVGFEDVDEKTSLLRFRVAK